eukprot:jgi/Ulvmu1/6652/UM003_0290.1
MLHCHARRGSVCCLAESAGCRLRAQGCTLTGATSACGVLEGAVATLVDTELHGMATGETEGVLRVHGATAWLLRCAVKDSVTAVRVNGGTVTARATHATNTFPRMVKSEDPRAPPNPGAAYSCPTGSSTVVGGSVKGCGVGFWVGAVHIDTQQATLSGIARVHRVIFEGYGSAFQVVSESNVEIVDCEFWGRDCEDAAARAVQTRGPNGERDFEVQAAMRFTKGRGCRFVGIKCDIAGEVAGTLRVARCMFKHRYMVDLPSAPSVPDSFRYASVAVRGEIDIDGCSFSNVEIGVSELGRDGAVRCCSFTQVCSAVTVMDGCGMKVVDCKADNCIQACVASKRSTLAVQDFECDTLGGFLISYGGGSVVTAKRVNVCARVCAFEVLSEGGPATEVELVDCNFKAQEAAVLLQGVGVRASILHRTLSTTGTGLLLNAPATAHLRSSAVRGCQVGLHVGDDPHFYDGACWACGVRSMSQRAQQAALAARVSGGKPGSKQRCPHEGGVARLTVTESAVYGCPFGMYIRTHGHGDAVALHLEDCGRSVVELHHGEHEMRTFRDCTFCSCREFACKEDERAPGEWIAGERIRGIRQVFEAPAGSGSD